MFVIEEERDNVLKQSALTRHKFALRNYGAEPFRIAARIQVRFNVVGDGLHLKVFASRFEDSVTGDFVDAF
jgi:hypothetical protein